MQWNKHLYVGKKAKKHRFSIIRGIRREKMQPQVYVITPASNGHNILDIYPSMVLLLPYYKEKELLILGIASGYWEALGVAERIVRDMYQNTGEFNLRKFLER